jgi:serine/threonine protein kinase/cytochrome c-type biogenesis protein CcmH/NrfG
MSPRWQAIERLFHAALERPLVQREAFVREEARDQKLADEVLALLNAAPSEDVPMRQPLDVHGLMEALGSAFLTGKQLGHYTVAEFLGEGGMGMVYRAIDQRDGSTVAIKILPPGQALHPSRLERFRREARAMAALQHPAIVCIREAGSDDGVHYLVMEYLEGETLRQRLQRAGPPSTQEVIEYGLAISTAFEAAHHAGVTHRDLKPENVMLTPSGPKVLDFGLAHLDERASPQRTTLESVLAGTVAYLAPEQIEGAPGTPQSDIFALGVLLYEAATGQALFQRANPIATARAILHEAPDYRLVPVALRPVLRRCLAKSSRRRYQSAGLVREDLEKIKSGIRLAEHRASPWIIAAAATILAVLAAAWLFHPRGTDPHAIEKFQLGKYHWNRRTPESMRKSVDYFRQASTIDPTFAPAYGWLAESLAMLPEYGLRDRRNTEAARQAAERAIQLDPKLYIAHVALAWIFFSYDWNWAAAEPEFRKAIALAPGEALPHQRYGLGLISRGRFREAEAELLRAQQLEPFAMLPMINLAELWYYAHRFDLEEAQLRKALERDPGYVLARVMLAKLEIITGRSKEAIAEMQRLLAMPEGANWCPQLAEAYASDGQRDLALKQLAVCAPTQPPFPSTFIYLGQPQRAIAALEEWYSNRFSLLAFLNVDPDYLSLRGEPDFQRLLRKMGF